MPKTSVSDVHKQIQIFPWVPPTLLRTKNQFYILCTQRNAKNFPNRQSALSLPLCLFLEGGRAHLKYYRLQRGWEHPTKFLMKRVIIESYPSNPTSPLFPIKNERSLRTCGCCLYYVTKNKSCGVNLWREFVCGGSRKGLKFPLQKVVVIELDT